MPKRILVVTTLLFLATSPAHALNSGGMLASGRTLRLFSVLGTYTGVSGYGGHMIEHQQRLVLTALAHGKKKKCLDAHVRIQWLNDDGQRVAADSSVIVPGCRTIKIQNMDAFFGIPNINGVSLRIFSDIPIAGTWVLEPLYEWPTQAILEEYAIPEEIARKNWIFPDVRFDSGAKSQDPAVPDFVQTWDMVAIKVANPGEREVGVNITLRDGVGGFSELPTVAIPPHGERMVILNDHYTFPFDGTASIEASAPVLVLGSLLRIAIPYTSAAPMFRALIPIGTKTRD